MSGLGPLQSFPKKDPAGSPFVAGSARNGLSIDGTGRVVLGNDQGDAAAPAEITSTREILDSGGGILLIAGQAANDRICRLTRDSIVFSRQVGIDEGSLTVGLMALGESTGGTARITLGANQLPEEGAVFWERAGGGVMYFGETNLTTNIFRFFIGTGNMVIGDSGLIDQGHKLQVQGNVSVHQVRETLDFPNTAAQTSSDLTVAFPGAVVGDTVVLGIVDTAVVLPDSSYWAFVSAADVVTIRFNNYSAAAQDPPQGSFSLSIFKGIEF